MNTLYVQWEFQGEKKNLNWLAVGEAVKLIEGVHFHYQLRSAYEHRSHKPVRTQMWLLFNFFAWRGRFCWHENWSRTELMSMSRVGMPIVSSCSLGLELMSMLMMKEKRSLKTRRKSGRRELSAWKCSKHQIRKKWKGQWWMSPMILTFKKSNLQSYSDLPNNGYVPLNF